MRLKRRLALGLGLLLACGRAFSSVVGAQRPGALATTNIEGGASPRYRPIVVPASEWTRLDRLPPLDLPADSIRELDLALQRSLIQELPPSSLPPAPAFDHPARPEFKRIRSGDDESRDDLSGGFPLGHIFDRSGKPLRQGASLPVVPGAGAGAKGRSIPRPRGVVGAPQVDVARTPVDLDRLLPHLDNDFALIQALKENIHVLGSIFVVRYRDANGGTFVALDLGSSQFLVDHIPTLYDHERALIRRILRHHRDVQLLVPEYHATPDLIVDGVVTELKTVMGNGHGIAGLLKSANTQLAAFGGRHGVGMGDVALDVSHLDSYARAMTAARDDIDQLSKEGGLSAENVRVFYRDYVVVFSRQPDGSYRARRAGGAISLAGRRPAVFA